jgi:NAD-dependent deacetylase
LTEDRLEKLRGDILTVADWIVEARSVTALTGAGISVESGIPDFRGKGGLWTKYDPGEYASIYNFVEDPDKVWNMLTELIDTVEAADQNPAHLALAELEGMGRLDGIITQNVDSLHQRAGSKVVVEFHGHNRSMRCQSCGKDYHVDKRREEMPPRCECGGYLRPNAVLFDEPIPMDAMVRARELASGSDLMLVIGTSATVAPASYMPYLTKSNDGRLVEVNPEVTQLTHDADLSLFGPAGTVMPAVVDAVRTRMEEKTDKRG